MPLMIYDWPFWIKVRAGLFSQAGIPLGAAPLGGEHREVAAAEPLLWGRAELFCAREHAVCAR